MSYIKNLHIIKKNKKLFKNLAKGKCPIYLSVTMSPT